MRCTECSTEIKPIVCIDIDGTLADYHGHLMVFIGHYLDTARLPHPYLGGEPMHEWFIREYKSDYKTWKDIKLAFRQGAHKRWMPAMPWASQLTQKVRDIGAELWITTTRPYLRLDSVDPDTREWLRRHDIKFDHLLYDDQKYRTLATMVDPARIAAVLDDLDEELVWAERLFTKSVCVLAVSSYNQAYHGKWPLALGGDQAFSMIKHRVDRWNESHRETAGHISARLGDPQPAQRRT